jgi:hypothetical protein
MNIYGEDCKDKPRSSMSMQDLIESGVSTDALMKRMRQMTDAEFVRDSCMVKINEAKSFRELRKALKQFIKASIYVEYINELSRIEPVAGPLYRPEEIRARVCAWRYIRKHRQAITDSLTRQFNGRNE